MATKKEATTMSDSGAVIRIVVAQRGFVFVGWMKREEEGVVVRRAKTIRRWGTTKGLGELFDGPRSGTLLDEAGTVRLHPLQIIYTLDVDQTAWSKALRS